MLADEILRLPITTGIAYEERVIDGNTVRVPRAERLGAKYFAADEPIMAWDSDGVGWKVVQLLDPPRLARMRASSADSATEHGDDDVI